MGSSLEGATRSLLFMWNHGTLPWDFAQHRLSMKGDESACGTHTWSVMQASVASTHLSLSCA